MASILVGLPRRTAALLRQGADPHRPDSAGTTPLYLASVQGEAAAARALLAAGADPDLESGTGEEGLPLCAAACWGHTATVRELLLAGANPNLREDHGTGRTAAEWAIHGGHHAALALLREAGAG